MNKTLKLSFFGYVLHELNVLQKLEQTEIPFNYCTTVI